MRAATTFTNKSVIEVFMIQALKTFPISSGLSKMKLAPLQKLFRWSINVIGC